MRKRFSLLNTAVVLVSLVAVAAKARAQALEPALEPIVYTVKFPEPAKNFALLEAAVPTGKQATIELMMPTWTPGFYRLENYAGKVQDLVARAAGGTALQVEQPKANRWRIETGGAATVVVSYKLLCTGRSVTGNWVGDDLMVLNGGPSFLTLVEKAKRPHDVLLELSPKWKQSMTGLDAAPDGKPHHYRAAEFDTLVDSPIVAGNLDVTEFDVDGSKHYVVAAGNTAQWDGKRAATDLRKIVQENRRLWGALPFKKYVFLFLLKGGGGGLEHANSALMFTSATATRGPAPHLPWLMFVSHEYFHAFNVKRLRPVELGPFDYDKAPRTTGLWVAEGLTTYYGDLIVCRAGLAGANELLARLSSHIDKLQKSPGRLVQTLEQASLDVWTSSMSGVGGSSKTVSYYVKGPVVGFLLDAKIRRATDGAKSLDDLMKLAYQRYGSDKGFTADQFRQTAEQVAGIDLKEAFRKWLATTEELEYTEALDWFGLRFPPTEGQAAKSWRLEVRADATKAQRSRLQAWLRPQSVAQTVQPAPRTEAPRTENVIVITWDGLRWQELFTGADETLLDAKLGGVKDLPGLKQRYWRDSPSERRRALLPFVWGTIAKQGQIFGDPTRRAAARSTNGLKFSYPGYHEIFCGFVDKRIDSNAKRDNPNLSVLEFLNDKPAFKNRVASFCTWDVFPFIFRSGKNGLKVHSGWLPVKDKDLSERERHANEIMSNVPRYWPDNTFDVFTMVAAREHLRRHKPRVLHIGLGETDEWGHSRRYDLYLDAAYKSDRYLAELWTLLQEMPEYKDKTAVVITTDHGRGSTRADWTDHGKKIPGAEFIWIAVLGPDTPSRGVRENVETTQGQVAATIARLLGEDFNAASPQAAPPLPDVCFAPTTSP